MQSVSSILIRVLCTRLASPREKTPPPRGFVAAASVRPSAARSRHRVHRQLHRLDEHSMSVTQTVSLQQGSNVWRVAMYSSACPFLRSGPGSNDATLMLLTSSLIRLLISASSGVPWIANPPAWRYAMIGLKRVPPDQSGRKHPITVRHVRR
jgi:hypothetical protein